MFLLFMYVSAWPSSRPVVYVFLSLPLRVSLSFSLSLSLSLALCVYMCLRVCMCVSVCCEYEYVCLIAWERVSICRHLRGAYVREASRVEYLFLSGFVSCRRVWKGFEQRRIVTVYTCYDVRHPGGRSCNHPSWPHRCHLPFSKERKSFHQVTFFFIASS